MISSRLSYAIVFGGIAMQAHAGEVRDAMTLYKAICIESKGDLTKAEQLTIENGFSIDSDDHGRKTFDRTGSGKLSAPFVILKPAGSNGDGSPLDICEIFGTTGRMAEFDSYAHSQGFIEVPKSLVFGDLPDQNYVRVYASEECQDNVVHSASCIFLETIGGAPKDASFSGVFRLGVPQSQAGAPL